MERLQGKIWYEKKPEMKFVNYSITQNGHYRVVVQDAQGKRYIHFLSPQEQTTFQKVESKYKDRLVTYEEQNRGGAIDNHNNIVEEIIAEIYK